MTATAAIPRSNRTIGKPRSADPAGVEATVSVGGVVTVGPAVAPGFGVAFGVGVGFVVNAAMKSVMTDFFPLPI